MGLGFAGVFFILSHTIGYSRAGMVIVPSILLASLTSPTDPAANLAVIHEYHAKGKVTSTILGVSGLDDILVIINFSIAAAVARMIATTSQLSVHDSVFTPLFVIFGGIITGIVFGAGFNAVNSLIARESEGAIIVYVFALLFLCYGTAGLFGLEELLTSLSMGVVVGNYNFMQEKIIGMIERYTEELIFVLFFTLSGMHLNFSIFPAMLPFVVLYVLLRTLGKYLGAVIGADMARSPKGLGKNVAWGLIPQGGIVIGLALLIGYDPAFSLISEPAIAVIIGATVVHEIVGPMMFKMALVKAGEIL
ncbi:MAG TPA: cation:proton antiporter [Deltaproteobacteria bacterium]|nr:cation:proton antiporter [Deltaproteobacteria bacterium]